MLAKCLVFPFFSVSLFLSLSLSIYLFLSFAAWRDKDQANSHSHFHTHFVVGAGGSLVRTHVAVFVILFFLLFFSSFLPIMPRLLRFVWLKERFGESRFRLTPFLDSYLGTDVFFWGPLGFFPRFRGCWGRVLFPLFLFSFFLRVGLVVFVFAAITPHSSGSCRCLHRAVPRDVRTRPWGEWSPGEPFSGRRFGHLQWLELYLH